MPRDRFAFGKNWAKFFVLIDEERIATAMRSLREALGEEGFEGKRFLDIGSGSGLFSLAAYRLGAEVVSFDYDEESVACTQKLKDVGGGGTSRLWRIFQGSVLDQDMLRSLGTFDVVYSWGVLHHTGNMKQAFENIAPLVAPNGKLFISIYNDQGVSSKGWFYVKRTYNSFPILRPVIVALCAPWQWKYRIAWGTIRYLNPLKFLLSYDVKGRGMSLYRDLVDWVGGYPFEVAKPETVFRFFKEKGFQLEHLKTCAGKSGCNEFVFRKKDLL